MQGAPKSSPGCFHYWSQACFRRFLPMRYFTVLCLFLLLCMRELKDNSLNNSSPWCRVTEAQSHSLVQEKFRGSRGPSWGLNPSMSDSPVCAFKTRDMRVRLWGGSSRSHGNGPWGAGSLCPVSRRVRSPSRRRLCCSHRPHPPRTHPFVPGTRGSCLRGTDMTLIGFWTHRVTLASFRVPFWPAPCKAVAGASGAGTRVCLKPG